MMEVVWKKAGSEGKLSMVLFSFFLNVELVFLQGLLFLPSVLCRGLGFFFFIRNEGFHLFLQTAWCDMGYIRLYMNLHTRFSFVLLRFPLGFLSVP